MYDELNQLDTFARSLALFDFQNEINPGPFVLCWRSWHVAQDVSPAINSDTKF